MADLGKKLPCESLGDQEFIESQTRRSAAIAAVIANTPQEKGFLRQKTRLNNIKERIEKILRSLSKTDADTTPGETKFTANRKESTEKSLRATISEIKRQEDFFNIAERHGYAVAENVEKYEIGGGLEDGTAKALSEVLDLYQ